MGKNEQKYSVDPFIKHCTSVGWIPLKRDEVCKIRQQYNDSKLKLDINYLGIPYLPANSVLKQLMKINNASEQVVINMFQKLMDNFDTAKGFALNNFKATIQLLNGISFTQEKEKRIFEFIDSKKFKNNIYHVVDNFEFLDYTTGKNRRPDLTFFINGIPISIVELKDPEISIEEAIAEIFTKEKEIPQLFQTVQISLACNNIHFNYFAPNTTNNNCLHWRYDKNCTINNHSDATHEWKLFIDHVLNPKNIIDFMRNYICYDKKSDNKIIARNNQFWASEIIINKIISRKKDASTNGLIWHYQGTGKSLLMVFISHKLTQIYNDAKIIVVSDRNDLDNQNYLNFLNHDFYIANDLTNPINANSIKNLKKELLNQSTKVMITTIHKSNADYVNKLKNNFILVDEAHRTTYGIQKKILDHMFPTGNFIGFTGTPIEKELKKTAVVFCKPNHTFLFYEAIRDKTVVKFVLEDVPQYPVQKDLINKHIQDLKNNYKWSNKQVDDFKKKIKRYGYINRNEKIMLTKCTFIYDTLKNKILRIQPEHCAMLITDSKKTALKYYCMFKKIFPDLNTVLTISSSNKLNNYKYYKEWISELENSKLTPKDNTGNLKMRVSNGEIKLIIVVDQLITGYDEKRLQALYLDRKFNETHTLLQALSRINRTNKWNKDFGLVFDFCSQGKKIAEALSYYNNGIFDDEKSAILSPSRLVEQIKSIKIEIINIIYKFTNIKIYFKFENNDIDEIVSIFRKNTSDVKKARDKFFKDILIFVQLYKNLKLVPEIKYKDLKWKSYDEFQEGLIKIRMQINELNKQKVSIFSIDDSIIEDCINQTYAPHKNILQNSDFQMKLSSDSIDEKLSSFHNPKDKIDVLSKILHKFIQERIKNDVNIEFYNNIDEEIQKLLNQLKKSAIDNIEFLKKLKVLKENIFSNQNTNDNPKTYIRNYLIKWNYHTNKDFDKIVKKILKYKKSVIGESSFIWYNPNSNKYLKSRQDFLKFLMSDLGLMFEKYKGYFKTDKEKTYEFDKLFRMLKNID